MTNIKEELKLMIDETINSNGKRHITGKSLNLALNAIVDSLGEFTPEVPETPDTPVVTPPTVSGNGVQSKDVNFYDYDGTLVYSYTWEEAEQLTELPAGPTHDGLTFQEWNYTLDDIKEQGGTRYYIYGEEFVYDGLIDYENTSYHKLRPTRDMASEWYDVDNFYVITPADNPITMDSVINFLLVDEGTMYLEADENGITVTTTIREADGIFGTVKGYADVGANYITSDGKTRFYFYNEVPNQTYYIRLGNSLSNVGDTLEVSWGDGTVENFDYSSDGNIWSLSHTYEEVGDYIVEVDYNNISGNRYITFSPFAPNTYNVFWKGCKKIEYGNGITEIPENVITETISIPTSVTISECILSTIQRYVSNLKCLIIPRTCQRLWWSAHSSVDNFIYSIPNVNIETDADYAGGYIGFNTDRLVIPKRIILAEGDNYTDVHIHAKELIVNCPTLDDFSLSGHIDTLIFNGANVGYNTPLQYADVDKIVFGPFLAESSFLWYLGTSSVPTHKRFIMDCRNCSTVPNVTTSPYPIEGGRYNEIYVLVSNELYVDFVEDSHWGGSNNYTILPEDFVIFTFDYNYKYLLPKNMTWREFVESPLNYENYWNNTTQQYEKLQIFDDCLYCVNNTSNGDTNYTKLTLYSNGMLTDITPNVDEPVTFCELDRNSNYIVVPETPVDPGIPV